MARNRLVKYLFDKLVAHKKGKKELTLRLITDDLVKYYGFKSKPPPDRYRRVMMAHNLMVSGLSEEQYKECIDGVVENLKMGIEKANNKHKTKKLSKAMAYLFTLQSRAGQPSYDMILEILALTLIRSDEDPNRYDEQIHEEKKEHLRSIIESTPDKIQHLPEYKMFYDSGIGGEMLEELKRQNVVTEETLKGILQY